jgi:hypothetical protein
LPVEIYIKLGRDENVDVVAFRFVSEKRELRCVFQMNSDRETFRYNWTRITYETTGMLRRLKRQVETGGSTRVEVRGKRFWIKSGEFLQRHRRQPVFAAEE